MTTTEIIEALERGGRPNFPIDAIERISELLDPGASDNWTANTFVSGIYGDVNAAIALAERVYASQILSWSIHDTISGASASILLVPEDEGTEPREVWGHTLASSPAAALCAAILKAKEAI